MWREMGHFLPLVIIVWSTRPPSAYSESVLICRKLGNVCKQSLYSPRTSCVCVVEKEKELMVKIFTSTTKFSRKAFPQSER